MPKTTPPGRPPADQPGRLYTIAEWCELTRISRATFYRLQPAPLAARFGFDLRIHESPRQYAERARRWQELNGVTPANRSKKVNADDEVVESSAPTADEVDELGAQLPADGETA